MGHSKRNNVARPEKRALLVALVLAGALTGLVTASTAAGTSGFSLSGKVISHGSPVSGATVYLQAWPSQATTLATPTRKHVSLYTLAVGKTASNGSFHLTTNLGNLPASDVNPNGVVNLREVVVGRKGWFSTRTFPANLKSPAKTESITRGSINRAIVRARVASSVNPRVRLSPAGVILPRSSSCLVPNGGYWTDSPSSPVQVVLGTAMNDNGIDATITYAHGSSTSTTLGVAYNDGSTWSANGSETNGTGATAGFKATGLRNVRQDAEWRYHTWVETDAPFGNDVCWKEAHPYAYYDKGITTSVDHTYFTNCGALYAKGQTFFRTSAKNGSYTDGVSLFGISLMSQAGWDDSMELDYVFSSTPGYVCGDTSGGPAAAPRVEAEIAGGSCGAAPGQGGSEAFLARRPNVIVC